MRISADRDSPHWIGPHNYHRYTVQLDGVAIKDAIEADDVERWVIVHKRNAQGLHVMNAEKTAVEREKRFGKVTIIDTRAYPVPKPAFGGILG